MNKSSVTKYKLCALVSFAVVLLSLMPDIQLWIARGGQWNGAYTSSTGDEVIYSAYLNALMDGRARKNDPFAGRDSTPSAPLPESSFSIQFVPPYVISFIARGLGISASTAMIALLAATALFASLSVFWLLNAILDDSRLAAVGTLIVLCFGGLAGGSGVVGVLLQNPLAIPSLPFLRRYQPAAAFPLFFVFNVLVWQSLTSPTRRRARVATAAAAMTLAILIFSYLYLWTAAATWFSCIALLWLYFRPGDRRRTLLILATLTITTSLALIPYAYLVSRRSPTMDETQALDATRQLDLFWSSEILGVVALAAIMALAWRRKISATDPRTLYVASMAMLPIVLFNQQLVTGKSLQPHHFAHFVVNYVVVAGLVMIAPHLRKTISSRTLIWLGAVCFCWGIFEVGLTARYASVPLAITRDKMIPAFQRLRKLSSEDGTIAGLTNHGRTAALVFAPSIEVSRMMPTWTSQGTLLDMRGLDFGSASNQDRKEFFFAHSYFCNMDPGAMGLALRDSSNDLELNFYARSTMWGYDRVIQGLSNQHTPIRPDEIEREVQNYQAYINSFSREHALKRPITYALIPVEGTFDFTNLDRWYERDAGDRIGDYVLYKLKLRP